MAPIIGSFLSATATALVLGFGSASPLATTPSPTVSYGTFTYTQVSSDRYATPLPSPLTFTTPFAPAFTDASTLLPSNLTYTTWSLDRDATTSDDGPYGQSAYASLWSPYTYTNTVPFTTTVSPTPVATSELVFPPALYNVPATYNLTLPFSFVWGVAASAWQIEGGLQTEGRGPAFMDSMGAVGLAASTNDSVVADMNYFLYKQDIARLAALGVPYYSFSVAWTRVVPFGVAGSPLNTQALDHYDDVINTCLAYGLTPIVTLTHMDSPAGIDLNGPREALVSAFMYYAKVVAARYADRVPTWITFNEPNLYPGILTAAGQYELEANVLFAHAAFYHWYKGELGGTGQVSIKFSHSLALPLGGPESVDDVAAAERYNQFSVGIMGYPLFRGEQFPAAVLATAGVNLTALTDDEIAYIHGTADFFAVDAYVSQFATAAPGGLAGCAANASDPYWPQCVVTGSTQANGWLFGAASAAYAYVAPQYVRQQLGYLWTVFRPVGGVMVTEFGFPVYGEAERGLDQQRYDLERTLYYQDFLAETLKAVHWDGVDVVGALAWSFLDNNEWGSYEDQYGMQVVNRTDGEFTRSFKRSMFDFVDFFHEHVASA